MDDPASKAFAAWPERIKSSIMTAWRLKAALAHSDSILPRHAIR
jgi:hypothetical protein